MPNLPKATKNEVVAILCSDLHLSLKTPVSRAEEDWLEVQFNYLEQLRKLSGQLYDKKIGSEPIPTIIAGDVFDKPNSSPELINFALRNLPDNCYAISGQHDQPLHSYEDLEKSAYWTLVEAKKIKDLNFATSGINPIEIGNHSGVPLRLHGFPFGFKVKPLENPLDLFIEIAVVHDLIWTKQTDFENAPELNRLRYFLPLLQGYDVAVFGDNHKGFLYKSWEAKVNIFNCGGFIRRKSDEIDYKPMVGLLYQDGTVIPHCLDTSKDKFVDGKETITNSRNSLDTERFMNELSKLCDTSINFAEKMKRVMEKEGVSEAVKTIILAAMEEK